MHSPVSITIKSVWKTLPVINEVIDKVNMLREPYSSGISQRVYPKSVIPTQGFLNFLALILCIRCVTFKSTLNAKEFTGIMDLRSEFEDRIRRYNARNGYEYATVAVLVMFWQDDDLGVFEEIKQLSSLFSNVYNFTVRQFVIPSYRAEAALTRGVGDFVYEFGGDDSLIILYYGGHGDPDRNGDKQSVWAA